MKNLLYLSNFEFVIEFPALPASAQFSYVIRANRTISRLVLNLKIASFDKKAKGCFDKLQDNNKIKMFGSKKGKDTKKRENRGNNDDVMKMVCIAKSTFLYHQFESCIRHNRLVISSPPILSDLQSKTISRVCRGLQIYYDCLTYVLLPIKVNPLNNMYF